MKITVNIFGEVQVEAGLKICQIRKHPDPAYSYVHCTLYNLTQFCSVIMLSIYYHDCQADDYRKYKLCYVMFCYEKMIQSRVKKKSVN